MLKERGAERSGYRGCLIGSVVFGLLGSFFTLWFARAYTSDKTPGTMPTFMFDVMFGAVGFIVGALVGCLVVLVFDLMTRKKESALDEF